MKRVFGAALAAVLMGVGISGQAVAASNGYAKQKVVYHINYADPQQQAGALGNIQNHINAVGKDNLELKVVLHGAGLSLLLTPDALEYSKAKAAEYEKLAKEGKADPGKPFKAISLPRGNADDVMAAKIDGLKAQGVAFNVCANTLKGKNVDLEGDLYGATQADVVPSGVAELAKLQAEGYTYIKP